LIRSLGELEAETLGLDTGPDVDPDVLDACMDTVSQLPEIHILLDALNDVDSDALLRKAAALALQNKLHRLNALFDKENKGKRKNTLSEAKTVSKVTRFKNANAGQAHTHSFSPISIPGCFLLLRGVVRRSAPDGSAVLLPRLARRKQAVCRSDTTAGARAAERKKSYGVIRHNSHLNGWKLSRTTTIRIERIVEFYSSHIHLLVGVIGCNPRGGALHSI